MHDFKGRQRKYTAYYTLFILAKFADLEKRGDINEFSWKQPAQLKWTAESRLKLERSCSEGCLNYILNSTAFFALNRLLDGVTSSSVALGGYKINADSASYIAHELKLLLLCEVKTQEAQSNWVQPRSGLHLQGEAAQPSRPNSFQGLAWCCTAACRLHDHHGIAKIGVTVLTTY